MKAFCYYSFLSTRLSPDLYMFWLQLGAQTNPKVNLEAADFLVCIRNSCREELPCSCPELCEHTSSQRTYKVKARKGKKALMNPNAF